jgi:hypothetical protein
MQDDWTPLDEAKLTEAYDTVLDLRDKLDKYGRAYHLAHDSADRIKALMRDLHMTLPER